MSRPSATSANNGSAPSRSKLTVMIYLAGDNNLSPSMISQLKAIKDAGFQKDTTVMVRFDPGETGAPTCIFEVNSRRKKKYCSHIGDGEDPFVRNLREDDVRLKPLVSADMIGELHNNTAERTEAGDALRSFLKICFQQAPADHYMLFMLGHGGVVGNDAFLPDDSPESAITLKQLGDILWEFARTAEKDNGFFDLVAMHSCSMSSIEVAYELRGTARYMMATEGISFVGSWPYRQLLKKIFHSVKQAQGELREPEMNKLLRKLCSLSLHNSTDFMFAGFSADLALCSLDKEVVESFNAPLKALTSALKATLESTCGEELILLAHWKAQSYWQENYTDLYDFCRCLDELCRPGYNLCRCSDKSCDASGSIQRKIRAACRTLMDELASPDEHRDGKSKNGGPRRSSERLIAFSRHFGPTYQYSHGLSIYFPWSRPIDDGVNDVIGKYKTYEFTKELVGGRSKSEDNSWLSFLEAYFEKTRRASREAEDSGKAQPYGRAQVVKGATVAVMRGGISVGVASNGASAGDSLPPGGPTGKPSPSLTGKTSPSDSGGVGCSCASIKNYPTQFPVFKEVNEKRPDQQGAE